MTADMQDIHDVFKGLLVYSPELAPASELRDLILRLASILADMLGRTQVLESQSEADLKTILEKQEALHHSDQAPYQLQLDNLATTLETQMRSFNTHAVDQAALGLGDVPQDISNLTTFAQQLEKRLAEHFGLHREQDLPTLLARFNDLKGRVDVEVELLYNHCADQRALNLGSLNARLDELRASFLKENNWVDSHIATHRNLELEAIPARLAGLDDKCASLAPLLALLPLPAPPAHTVTPKEEESS